MCPGAWERRALVIFAQVVAGHSFEAKKYDDDDANAIGGHDVVCL